jgi:hypothetical protein
MSLGAAWNFFKEFLKNSNPIDGTAVAGSVLSVAPGDGREVQKACERLDLVPVEGAEPVSLVQA